MKKRLLILFIMSLFLFLPGVVKAEGFTLTYDVKGSLENVSELTDVNLKTASKTGYIFKGWSTTSNGSIVYKAGKNISLTEDTTLYAVLTPIKYTITFNANGGTGKMSKISCTYDKACQLPNVAFTKKNSKFVKWNTRKDEKGKSYNNKQNVKNLTTTNNGNVTLYAIFGSKYTIKFNANGGKASKASVVVYKGLKYGTLPTATKKYYTLDGWYTAKSGGTKIVNTSIYNYSKNITLYAHWKPVNYKITYNLNGGKNNASNPSTYNINSVITLKNPTRVDSKFLGWYSDSKFKNKVTTIKKGSYGNKVLYAKWQSSVSVSKQNALKKAQSYLNVLAFSYEGLIDQLKFEGFSTSDAEYGVKNCGANWNNQAIKKAKSYLSALSFSKEGLIKQLEYEKFTHEQAVYGVNHCGANWNEQAVKSAKSYIKSLSFSKEGLIEQLEFEGFTHEQAVYGVENCGANFESEVVRSAKSYLNVMAFSREGLISQLEFEGFSHEESVKAVDELNVNWNEQAAKSAKSYLNIMSFSRSELIEQLEFEGFTHEQAVYGANANGLF